MEKYDKKYNIYNKKGFLRHIFNSLGWKTHTSPSINKQNCLFFWYINKTCLYEHTQGIKCNKPKTRMISVHNYIVKSVLKLWRWCCPSLNQVRSRMHCRPHQKRLRHSQHLQSFRQEVNVDMILAAGHYCNHSAETLVWWHHQVKYCYLLISSTLKRTLHCLACLLNSDR